MTEEAYLTLLNNNPYQEEILQLFRFFERYINEEHGSDTENLNAIKNLIDEHDIKMVVSDFGKRLFKDNRLLIRDYNRTLQRYLSDFCRLNISEENREKCAIKWRNVLMAYVNLSRVVPEDQKIQEYQQSVSPTKKTVLAVAMLKLTAEDTIRVNEEIDHIQELSLNSANYLVLPIHGCVFDTFKTRLKNTHVDFIHLAGHGDVSKIEFADAAVRYSTMKKYITEQYDLCFFNCCNTYDFVEKTAVPFSQETICYENNLPANQAVDVSGVFYQSVFAGVSVADAWNTTQVSTNTMGYHIV